MLARVDDIEAARLVSGFDDAFALVAGQFFRREGRARARACLAGLLSGLGRKTGWSLAGHAGEQSPAGMQRLFTTARWEEDLVRPAAGPAGAPARLRPRPTRSAAARPLVTGTQRKLQSLTGVRWLRTPDRRFRARG